MTEIKSNLFSLEGKNALVTGSARGLGFEMAKALGLAGAKVYINGRNQQNLTEAAIELGDAGVEVEALAFDIADETAIEMAFSKLSKLDILINNVGMRDRRTLFEFEANDIQKMMDVDLIAPLLLSRHAAKMMMTQEAGRIINITSIAGIISDTGDAAYTAAKAGLEGLTKALAAELGPNNITVNAIAPGYFATKTNAELAKNPATLERLKQCTSLGRWGKPEELGGAAVFLASDAASYVTGHTLVVDGGYTTHY